MNANKFTVSHSVPEAHFHPDRVTPSLSFEHKNNDLKIFIQFLRGLGSSIP